MDKTARAFGQIYTSANPFALIGFQRWAICAGLDKAGVTQACESQTNLIGQVAPRPPISLADNPDLDRKMPLGSKLASNHWPSLDTEQNFQNGRDLHQKHRLDDRANLLELTDDQGKRDLTDRMKQPEQPRHHNLSCQTGPVAGTDLPLKTIVEPFAGANSLIRHLETIGYQFTYKAFDIQPAASDVQYRDTLNNFPQGFDVCITNPPWLAKNSAKARGLPFPACPFDDLYKFALSKCLLHCSYVAALVPEAFIRSGLFHDRLTDFISIGSRLFLDTAHPTGLALFGPGTIDDILIWADNIPIGYYQELKAQYMPPTLDIHTETGAKSDIRFNAPDGNLGLVAFDNVREASIRFCSISEISDYEIKQSSRFITRIAVAKPPQISVLNHYLNQLRTHTHDVFLSSYRGLRKDGMYRRRLDWDLARRIIYYAQ